MDDEFGDVVEPDTPVGGTEFKPARFHAQLGLPAADDSLLTSASAAVRQEYRDCSKWKRLRCRKVSIFSERDRGTVYVVHVGSSVEFDWTWEGAVAFRPKSLDDDRSYSDSFYENTAYEDEIVWKGEVLEVDERNGCLFISLDNLEAPPTTGSFFVRPFEFLSVLDAVYNDPAFEIVREDFSGRLAAAEGGIHPAITKASDNGLPQMMDWWQHSWGVLWGPPGTGKTYTTGQQIAAALGDPRERILVVSTTNRATDAVALAIGNAAKSRSSPELADGKLLRIGKGASLQAFTNTGLEAMLRGTEAEVMSQIDGLAQQLPLFDNLEEKAFTRKQLGELRAKTGDQSKRLFVDPEVRVVVATAFKAISFLKDGLISKMIESGDAPFATIFIDEAGLISRAAVAALSRLAARRVVLVGDSKQLAPISRISRILPTRQQTWLASSGLSHLDDLKDTPAAVFVLDEQRRMHPDVCRVVSEFQYGGLLKTATDTVERPSNLPPFLANFARAIWYVLDAEETELAEIRADRGPGNRSWVRSITPDILKKLFSDSATSQAKGLFISPYKAQAQVISRLLARWKMNTWEASTVHSQQGWEADIVVFDTVNASSYNWPYDEWKRLVNVALSRAREAVIVLASRGEMEEPYLKPLLRHLTPGVLVKNGSAFRWEQLHGSLTEAVAEATQKYETYLKPKSGMGDQVARRKSMKSVLSREQQRLANLKLDGKPRLVRGVAGSGKSIVLCNWLAKTVMRLEGAKDAHILAVYANRSLHKLLQDSVESAWQGLTAGELFEHKDFPWEKVSLRHVKDVLAEVLATASLSMDDYHFDYDRAAEEFLNRQDVAELLPHCKALFIDEAQDIGPSTLKLLLALVEQTNPADMNSRSAHIFYDNAQNIYGRKTPKWSEFGLDMRGRSAIMRESFRSTTQITELAVNVRHQLTPPDKRQDQNELVEMGLIERTERGGQEWLRVRFSQVDGPKPIFRLFDHLNDEVDRIFTHLNQLITQERVSPNDICLIYNNESVVIPLLESKLSPRLAEIGVELSVQTNRPYERKPNTLVVTTSHSYKGYESEVIMIPCVDQFVTADGQILANHLYVAMTRARSMLAIYGSHGGSSASRRVNETIKRCLETLNTPETNASPSRQDDLHDILERIGFEHRDWLEQIWAQHDIRQEPITDSASKIIAEPLFWFEYDGATVACFGDEALSQDAMRQLDINAIGILEVGADVAESGASE